MAVLHERSNEGEVEGTDKGKGKGENTDNKQSNTYYLDISLVGKRPRWSMQLHICLDPGNLPGQERELGVVISKSGPVQDGLLRDQVAL